MVYSLRTHDNLTNTYTNVSLAHTDVIPNPVRSKPIEQKKHAFELLTMLKVVKYCLGCWSQTDQLALSKSSIVEKWWVTIGRELFVTYIMNINISCFTKTSYVYSSDCWTIRRFLFLSAG